MVKPTENEKKTKKTEHDYDGKIKVQGVEQDVKIKVKTTPNGTGGYSTNVIVPNIRMTGKKEV